jgi:hemolysin activation/secretion protein
MSVRGLFAAVLACCACVPVFAQDVRQNEAPTADSATLRDSVSRTQVQVTRIDLLNNTVLPERDVRAIVAPYEQRAISSEELQELRFRLSQAYVDRGFVNSGVVVPDQQVQNGVIVLTAVEGTLTDIQIDGNRRLSEQYFSNRIKGDRDGVLNVFDLQNSLQRIQQDPLVRQINARLVPGVAAGQSELRLQVREHSPYYIAMRADNHRASSVGEERVRLSAAHLNLSGHHDALTFDVGNTEGVRDGFVSYRLPITARDSMLEAYYSADDTNVIEQPFDLLDIRTNTQTAGVNLTHPFVRRPNDSLVASFGFYDKRSESELLGAPFSFNYGDVDGRSRVRVVPLSVEWTGRRPSTAFSARGTFRLGSDELNVRGDPNAPDTEFSAFLGQLQFVRRLPWRQIELNARSAFQLTDDPLLAIEKFPVGGANSVRGYRENQLVRDNGVVASVELRIPLSKDATVPRPSNVRLVPFLDYGRSWDEDRQFATAQAATISSIGLGLVWDPSRLLHIEIFHGNARDDVGGTNDDSWQARGWHFSLALYAPLGRYRNGPELE